MSAAAIGAAIGVVIGRQLGKALSEGDLGRVDDGRSGHQCLADKALDVCSKRRFTVHELQPQGTVDFRGPADTPVVVEGVEIYERIQVLRDKAVEPGSRYFGIDDLFTQPLKDLGYQYGEKDVVCEKHVAEVAAQLEAGVAAELERAVAALEKQGCHDFELDRWDKHYGPAQRPTVDAELPARPRLSGLGESPGPSAAPMAGPDLSH